MIVLSIMQLVAVVLITLVITVIVLLYLDGTFRGPARYNLTEVPSPEDPGFMRVLPGLSDSICSTGRVTGFWVESDAIYAARIEAIKRAQERIHFETYYMVPGRRTEDFAEALIERARAGVAVCLVIDHQGCLFMPTAYWERLEAAGCCVKFFRPFSLRAPLDYKSRTHRKLLLIDGQEAFIGGTGVSDEWDGKESIGDRAPWLDLEVALEGPVVGVLEGKFMHQWANVGGDVSLDQCIFPPTNEADSDVLVTSGTYSMDSSDLRMLFHANVAGAKRRIWLASPYFMPDRIMRRALMDACDRGVEVCILTMGPRNDRKFVYNASRQLYHDLLVAGAQIWEYQPSLMHAKVMLVDDYWVTTGSANLDPLSMFDNDELDVSVCEQKLGDAVEDFFSEAFTASRRITLTEWYSRSPWDRASAKFWLLFHKLL